MGSIDNKFVIGIGSQRAGSTLLHRILDRCTDIFMHPVKELHYFDTLFDVRRPAVLREFSERQLKRIEDTPAITKPQQCRLRANRMLATRKVENIDYVDLYRPCLLGSEFVGEVTPEYMILPEEGVKHMRETIGDSAKIILLTRDPFERFLSSFKLLKAYTEIEPDFSDFEQELLDVFERMPSWVAQQRQLNDYAAASERYQRHFSNFLSIEFDALTALEEPLIEQLEEFLGLELKRGPLQNVMARKVNSLAAAPPLSDSALEIARQRFFDE